MNEDLKNWLVEFKEDMIMKSKEVIREEFQSEMGFLKEEIKKGKEKQELLENILKSDQENNEVKFQKLEKEIEELKTQLTRRNGEGSKKQRGEEEEEEVVDIEKERMQKEMEWIVEEKRRAKKKRNITMSGWAPKTAGFEKDLSSWMSRVLQIEVEFRNVWKIEAKKIKFGAECKKAEDKEMIMKNKSKLKDKGLKIFIDHDSTYVERRNKEMIRKRAKTEKNNGNKVKIGYNKLTVNGEEWWWNERVQDFFRKRSGDGNESEEKEEQYEQQAEEKDAGKKTN